MRATDAVMAAPPQMDEPIRAEIFGMERLEQHAESLAAAQRTTEKPSRGKNLLARIDEDARVLLAAYRDIAKTVQEKREITPAAEWLLDNFHIVDEQIRDIRDHLPKGYYRLLPKIAEGHLVGHPRVYGLAWAYVAHTDSRFQLGTLQRFVRAYQRVQPLTIGEGWAIAIHLRVALVENLRRLAQLIVRSRQARARADELADRLLGLSGWRVEQAEDVLRRVGDGPLVDAFAMQLFQRLRDQDASVMPVLDWLNEKLSAQGTSADEVVAREQHAQGAANVTVRNIITSMQWMSSVDWTDFFEAVSLVDEVLRAVPGFAEMDSETRILCRVQIEMLSRGSRHSELEVARKAVRLARDAGEESTPEARPGAGGVDEPRPRLGSASWNFPVFPGGPRSIRRTTSCPREDWLSRSVWAFVSPCETDSAASIAPMRLANIWERLPASPPSWCPAFCSSPGLPGQVSRSSSCWDSWLSLPPRRLRYPWSIAW